MHQQRRETMAEPMMRHQRLAAGARHTALRRPVASWRTGAVAGPSETSALDLLPGTPLLRRLWDCQYCLPRQSDAAACAAALEKTCCQTQSRKLQHNSDGLMYER